MWKKGDLFSQIHNFCMDLQFFSKNKMLSKIPKHVYVLLNVLKSFVVYDDRVCVCSL